ncbi:protein rtoA-like [Paramacrobiotus metropolitanus]|uniref:protein rtoA-like n=1 Tax=Paramacrobiotus metropolitanus TaxID=2943436 RepID=UPI002445FFD3|nr:protein rtoA-like [Paramacrobiotus metropolitanus]
MELPSKMNVMLLICCVIAIEGLPTDDQSIRSRRASGNSNNGGGKTTNGGSSGTNIGGSSDNTGSGAASVSNSNKAQSSSSNAKVNGNGAVGSSASSGNSGNAPRAGAQINASPSSGPVSALPNTGGSTPNTGTLPNSGLAGLPPIGLLPSLNGASGTGSGNSVPSAGINAGGIIGNGGQSAQQMLCNLEENMGSNSPGAPLLENQTRKGRCKKHRGNGRGRQNNAQNTKNNAS